MNDKLRQEWWRDAAQLDSLRHADAARGLSAGLAAQRLAEVGETGLIARCGHTPVGYFGDPAKSAEVFQTIEGKLWAIAGDAARLDEDGMITIFGRGSTCINSGGEKIFPEEVEEAKLSGVAGGSSSPTVVDCAVVGGAASVASSSSATLLLKSCYQYSGPLARSPHGGEQQAQQEMEGKEKEDEDAGGHAHSGCGAHRPRGWLRGGGRAAPGFPGRPSAAGRR